MPDIPESPPVPIAMDRTSVWAWTCAAIADAASSMPAPKILPGSPGGPRHNGPRNVDDQDDADRAPA